MAYDVTTEWDDNHRKLGNYEALPEKKTQAEYTNEAVEAIEELAKADEQAEKDELDDLDECQDDFLEQYKKKRMEEMKLEQELSTLPKVRTFGMLYEIVASDYVREVNNAGEGVHVLLNLYEDSMPSSLKINLAFEELCKEHPTMKFVKSQASKCVENFPITNLPYILHYFNSKMINTVKREDFIGINSISPYSLSTIFKKLDIFPKDKEGKRQAKNYRDELLRVKGKDIEEFDSDEDEREDKQFASNKMTIRF